MSNINPKFDYGIINNEVEIAIETIFKQVRNTMLDDRDLNAVNKSRSLLWDWGVQEGLITVENKAEMEAKVLDAEVFATWAHDELTRIAQS
jgi:hypothetical protein